MRDPLDNIKDAIYFGVPDYTVIHGLDNYYIGWDKPTATDVEWDKIALNYEPECNHKWSVWPFDYKKLCCAYCGREKPNVSNH